jgi:hypothetical protein
MESKDLIDREEIAKLEEYLKNKVNGGIFISRLSRVIYCEDPIQNMAYTSQDFGDDPENYLIPLMSLPPIKDTASHSLTTDRITSKIVNQCSLKIQRLSRMRGVEVGYPLSKNLKNGEK